MFYQTIAEQLKELVKFNAANPLKETKAHAETVFFNAVAGLDQTDGRCDYARFLVNFHLHPKHFDNVKDWGQMGVKLNKLAYVFAPEKRRGLDEITDPQHTALILHVRDNLMKAGVWA